MGKFSTPFLESETTRMDTVIHFIVVRHSERLDDVDEGAWRAQLAAHNASSNSSRSSATATAVSRIGTGRYDLSSSGTGPLKSVHSSTLTKERNLKYVSSDPPLSNNNGFAFAQDAGNTIRNMILRAQKNDSTVIDRGAKCNELSRFTDRIVLHHV